jgi:hypothetical protein
LAPCVDIEPNGAKDQKEGCELLWSAGPKPRADRLSQAVAPKLDKHHSRWGWIPLSCLALGDSISHLMHWVILCAKAATGGQPPLMISKNGNFQWLHLLASHASEIEVLKNVVMFCGATLFVAPLLAIYRLDLSPGFF